MPDPAADVVALLGTRPGPLVDTVVDLPGVPGLVAWWASPDVLPAVGGGPHPAGGLRLLEVGTATNLRNRVTRQDLYRTGVSVFRRVLAGLLLGELALSPTWAADVVLPRADEDHLTRWMSEHVLLTWCARVDRGTLLDPVVAAMRPGLHADGEPARAALDRYAAAAGPRVRRVAGEPFRRP